MKITLKIEAEVERTTGKFISKSDIAEELKSEVENSDPGSVSIDDSEYEVTSWEVSVEE